MHRRSTSNSYRVDIATPRLGIGDRKDVLRVQPSTSSAVVRGGKLRVVSTFLLGAIALIWWQRARTGLLAGEDGLGPPPVPRLVLDRLQELEDLLGGADRGDDDVRGWGMAYRPQRSPAAAAEPDDETGTPRVAAIPEPLRYPKLPLPPAPPEPTLVPAATLDATVCPAQAALGLPCAFLVPGFVGEQETKAQLHLHQLGLLALHLNRTLVLPNVSKSRMGTCFSYPFDLYYAPESLARLGVPSVQYATFVRWTLERDPRPTAQLVSVMAGKQSYPSGAIEVDTLSDDGVLPPKPDRNLCLDRGRTGLDFATHSPITIWGPERWHQSEQGRIGYGESIVRTLQGPEARSSSWRSASAEPASPDVLVFNYEIRHPILQPEDAPTLSLLPFEHFPYASTWLRLGAFLASRLRPYVAVHWRQETLDPAVLAECADGLVAKLAEVRSTHPDLRRFYLATDYPLEDLEDGREGTVAHSGTFARLLTASHHSAMRKLLRDLSADAGAGIPLTTFAREQAQLVRQIPHDLAADLAAALPDPGSQGPLGRSSGPAGYTSSMMATALRDLDAGLWGIIDKVVSMSADVFLSGEPGVCAKESSFTRQIAETRVSLAADGADEQALPGVRLRNVVEYWSPAGRGE